MDKEKKMYDLIIIGAGPAGLGASIYASRYKLDHIVIGNEIGGQVVEASEIENWAGEVSIPGKTLMEKFEHHARHFGVKIIQSDVSSVAKIEEGFEIVAGGEKYSAKSLILALGMKARKMNVPGEDKFVGKGVSYCATCDAMFFREKDVVVIGGGDAAATAAIHLTEFAKSVKLIYRDAYNWEPSWDEQIEKSGKVEKIKMNSVKEIVGDAKVSGVVLDVDGQEKKLDVQGVFIEVGTTPGVAIAQGLGVALDEQSYIIVDQTQATNVENVFASGDVTTGSNKFRQIITAVAEGAVAAGSVYKKLKLKK
ncbi:MAG: FAD-dependent oxidoreductase [Candidatus Moranbacteria bacterium]|jgi:thioredoxin reductase (NADPH)|nr:FAD-dependent oxidoreductase [Candidatus Moranbacteria bacterium]